MPRVYANGLIKKIYANGLIKKIYAHYGPGETHLVYSASVPVTYIVSSGVSYTEEVKYGSSCLSPSSFVPSRNGYKFIGWAETSGGALLESKVAGTEPITLYAVFIPNTITINYSNRGTYPYVATSGEYTSSDGWKNTGYMGAGLIIQDVGRGYINKLIDFTHYRTLTVNMQGVWYNHTGTLTFGVGTTAGGSFTKSKNVAYPEAQKSASGSLDISSVMGSGYIKFANNGYKTCGITSIVLSV